MNTDNYGVYGSETVLYGGTVPVWKHIDNDGTEEAGGKFKVVASFATEYPAGTIIPVGTPVNLSAPGGDLTILKTYEVAATWDASDTTISFKALGVALPLVAGVVLMKAPATTATTGAAYTVPADIALNVSTGFYDLSIVANAWGTATAGDIFVEADSAGGSGKVIKTIPTGLLRREVRINAGATAATGASVFHGEIRVDRIPPIPACVKTVLPMIKFTGE
jgi:hypothetical protein